MTDKKLNELIEKQLKLLALDVKVLPQNLKDWRQFLQCINSIYEERNRTCYLLLHFTLKAYTELNIFNKKLQLAQRIAMMGYWDYDRISRQFVLSKTLATMLGFDPDKLRFEVDEVAKLIHPDDKDLVFQTIKSALHLNNEYDIQVRIKSHDGQYRWYRCMGDSEMREKAMETGVVLDITSRKQLDDELAAAKALTDKNILLQSEIIRVQETDRLKNEFLANMSHELRTPLNTIIGFSEIIYYDEAHPVSLLQKEFLHDVLVSSKHLLHLINDVLDLAKIEAGKIDFESQPLVLSTVINECCEFLKNTIVKKNIHVTVKVDPSIENISNDEARLKEILFNFLSNAIKFTAPEGKITIHATPHGEQDFRLAVKDTGIGIRHEELYKLFVAFKQLDTGRAKKYQGTGLGLAITRLIVEAQGGKVGVKSKEGVGSTFYAILPRILLINIPKM